MPPPPPPPAALKGADQLQYLQHLLYLLPPCNCDTLLRLLHLLHTVQSYAQDSVGTNDEEVESQERRPVDGPGASASSGPAGLCVSSLVVSFGSFCAPSGGFVCFW